MIIDGRAIADDIHSGLRSRRDDVKSDVTLGIVVAPGDPVIESFVRIKSKIAAMLHKNRIFIERCQSIGIMPPDEALDLGWTGPNLRASGIGVDMRRDNPYLVYNELDFNVITRTEGDVLARYHCRFDEERRSGKPDNEYDPCGGPHAASGRKLVFRISERTKSDICRMAGGRRLGMVVSRPPGQCR